MHIDLSSKVREVFTCGPIRCLEIGKENRRVLKFNPITACYFEILHVRWSAESQQSAGEIERYKFECGHSTDKQQQREQIYAIEKAKNTDSSAIQHQNLTLVFEEMIRSHNHNRFILLC